ncbi:hypothetical protein HPT27_11775 [Permianibacter sp. IMCC34836]|uniref:hypothetical protein n=1 Tax=Permianibacter fluminis TaxID=2738515 RepID=UPI00155677D4|nr:hypothetical protein [Permianibacter fluminis]NQD37705.1 hypothetical protein [Permianibacter fluminis]
MTAYDVDKLMAEARRLAADYHKATGLTLPLSNEIARHDAMRLLDLQAPAEAIAGVDAIGTGERAALKFQIKGRVLFEESRTRQRVGQLGFDGQWDIVVLVLMNEEYQPLELIEASRETLSAALAEIKPNKRGAMTVARFRNLGRVVWQAEKQAA